MTDASCHDCGKDTFANDKDYYMVKDDLWKEHGVGKGFLCIDCLEQRLGRKLELEDILLCPLTTLFNPYTRNIILETTQ